MPSDESVEIEKKRLEFDERKDDKDREERRLIRESKSKEREEDREERRSIRESKERIERMKIFGVNREKGMLSRFIHRSWNAIYFYLYLQER